MGERKVNKGCIINIPCYRRKWGLSTQNASQNSPSEAQEVGAFIHWLPSLVEGQPSEMLTFQHFQGGWLPIDLAKAPKQKSKCFMGWEADTWYMELSRADVATIRGGPRRWNQDTSNVCHKPSLPPWAPDSSDSELAARRTKRFIRQLGLCSVRDGVLLQSIPFSIFAVSAYSFLLHPPGTSLTARLFSSFTYTEIIILYVTINFCKLVSFNALPNKQLPHDFLCNPVPSKVICSQNIFN